jgi:hypothetical protein
MTDTRSPINMIGHTKRAHGKWALGQLAPIMTPEDLEAIIKRVKEKGWLNEGERPRPSRPSRSSRELHRPLSDVLSFSSWAFATVYGLGGFDVRVIGPGF